MMTGLCYERVHIMTHLWCVNKKYRIRTSSVCVRLFLFHGDVPQEFDSGKNECLGDDTELNWDIYFFTSLKNQDVSLPPEVFGCISILLGL